MDERRKFPRTAFREAVRYGFEGNRFGGWLGCDLSEGGIRLHVNGFVPLKTEIKLTFSLGTRHVPDLRGRVVWVQKVPCSEGYQLGVEFNNFGPGSRAVTDIQQYVDENTLPKEF